MVGLKVCSNFVQIGLLVESNNSLRRLLSGAEILEDRDWRSHGTFQNHEKSVECTSMIRSSSTAIHYMIMGKLPSNFENTRNGQWLELVIDSLGFSDKCAKIAPVVRPII